MWVPGHRGAHSVSTGPGRLTAAVGPERGPRTDSSQESGLLPSWLRGTPPLRVLRHDIGERKPSCKVCTMSEAEAHLRIQLAKGPT